MIIMTAPYRHLQGRELYHGPVRELDAYLASQGFVRPCYMDVADFASEVRLAWRLPTGICARYLGRHGGAKHRR